METELLDKDIAIGSHDRDTIESDIFRFYNLSTTLEVYERSVNYQPKRIFVSLTDLVSVFGCAIDQCLLEFAFTDVLHRIKELRNACCISCQLGKILVGIHDASKSIYETILC